MLRLAVHTLLGVAVIALLFAGVSLLALKQTGSRALSVQSGSMEPSIQKGDLVIVKDVPQYQVGDVITYMNPRNENVTITHRIISIDQRGRIVAKGDANGSADKAITARMVVGKVDRVVPGFGTVMDFARTPVGLLLIIYVPALLIVISEMRRLAAHYARRVYRLLRADSRSQPNARHRRLMSVLKTGVVVAVMAPLVLSGSVYAALRSSTVLTGNTISSVAVPQQYVVCLFPEWRNLMSYALGDALYPKLNEAPLALNEPILPGTYRVSGESSDDHLANPNEPVQTNERWFLQLYGDNAGEPAYQTGPTDDLPEDVNTNVSVMDESITFTDTITALRYAHAAWPDSLEIDQFGGRTFDSLTQAEKRQVLWHSVHPGCVTFTRLPADEQF